MLLDLEIFLEFKAGSDRALSKIFEKYKTDLFLLANGYLPGFGDEILQDTFFSLWKHRDKINDEGHLKKFLFVTCRNLAIDMLRKAKRDAIKHKKLQSEMAQFLADREHFPQEIMARLGHLYKKWEEGLNSLPPQCKRVFLLTIEELTPQEIALELNITTESVKNQLYKGIARMRQTFQITEPVLALFFGHAVVLRYLLNGLTFNFI